MQKNALTYLAVENGLERILSFQEARELVFSEEILFKTS